MHGFPGVAQIKNFTKTLCNSARIAILNRHRYSGGNWRAYGRCDVFADTLVVHYVEFEQ